MLTSNPFQTLVGNDQPQSQIIYIVIAPSASNISKATTASIAEPLVLQAPSPAGSFVPIQLQAPPPPPPYQPPQDSAAAHRVMLMADGRAAISVVDPMTRKLVIPCDAILETRAHQRASIPSLCQLFLQGRCRQGFYCHQVHADPAVVDHLRQQVQSLPLCCVTHGDEDHTEGSSDSRAILIPSLKWNDGLVPIARFSFTRGLQNVLQQNLTTVFRNEIAIVASGSDSNICRLHVLDRCRFAEDCKFLHVCKEIAFADPSFSSTATSLRGGGTYWNGEKWQM